MDILRFISWWWNKRRSYEQVMIGFIAWTTLLVPGLFVLGFTAMIIYFLGIIFCLLGYFIFHIFLAIRNQWSNFKQEREQEAQRIVNRLSGNEFIPASESAERASKIMAALRARRT